MNISAVEERIRKLKLPTSSTEASGGVGDGGAEGATEDQDDEDPSVVEREMERQEKLITRQALRKWLIELIN